MAVNLLPTGPELLNTVGVGGREGMSRYTVAVITVLAFAGFANRADATVVFSGNSGGLSASASFSISGNQLTILLTNTDAATGAGAPGDPASVLSGLFFNLGTATLTPVSARHLRRCGERRDPAGLDHPDGELRRGSVRRADQYRRRVELRRRRRQLVDRDHAGHFQQRLPQQQHQFGELQRRSQLREPERAQRHRVRAGAQCVGGRTAATAAWTTTR